MFIRMTENETPIDYGPEVHRRLTSMSRTAASYFYSIEADEFYSIAWLAFHDAKQKGKSDTLSFARAEFELKSAMREWVACEKGDVVEDGLIGEMHLRDMVDPLSEEPRKTRTKLPRAVKRALKRLTPRERRALYLGYMWNRTHEEIAADLGVSKSRAGTLRFEALAKLRKVLGVTTE